MRHRESFIAMPEYQLVVDRVSSQTTFKEELGCWFCWLRPCSVVLYTAYLNSKIYPIHLESAGFFSPYSQLFAYCCSSADYNKNNICATHKLQCPVWVHTYIHQMNWVHTYIHYLCCIVCMYSFLYGCMWPCHSRRACMFQSAWELFHLESCDTVSFTLDEQVCSEDSDKTCFNYLWARKNWMGSITHITETFPHRLCVKGSLYIWLCRRHF